MTTLDTTWQRLIYALSIVFLSIVLSSGFAIWYVGYQNQKWCEALAIFTATDPRTQATPTTPAGKQQRASNIVAYDALVNLRRTFNCPGVNR